EARTLVVEEFVMLELAEARGQVDMVLGAHGTRLDGEHSVLEQRVGQVLDVAIVEAGIPVDARHPRREWTVQLDDLHEDLQRVPGPSPYQRRRSTGCAGLMVDPLRRPALRARLRHLSWPDGRFRSAVPPSGHGFATSPSGSRVSATGR